MPSSPSSSAAARSRAIARRAATVAFFAIALASSIARAREPDAAYVDAPAPPTLPNLTHKNPTYTYELTAASIEPSGAQTSITSTTRAYALFAHNELEVPFIPRKWYLGFEHDLVAGAVPGVGHDFFVGNPELLVRGVWSNTVGLSSGGGIGVVLPFPRDILLGGTEEKVLETVRVVRPWDASYFQNLTLTLRPWFDIRHIAGPFILQLRQGLDWSVVTRTLNPNEHRQDYVARATFYAGYRVSRPVGVGLELWEVYQITADVDDSRRAATAISPSVRFMLGNIEPALSLLFPIATPLRGEAASYVAARLNVSFVLGPR